MAEKDSKVDASKREILKKSVYVVPAVFTLAAAPSFASAGSSKKIGTAGGNRGRQRGQSGAPPAGGSGRFAANAESVEIEKQEEEEVRGRRAEGSPDAASRIASR